jgi:Lon protease-like protein
MDDQLARLTEFNGVARLFPLPDLVLFPHVVQPLHVFERRYRQMVQHALEGDRLIAVVLLKPGWEDLYEDRPAIHRVACLGQIEDEQRLSDGKYNLLLRGLCRVRLGDELPREHLYRTAPARLLADAPFPDQPLLRKMLLKGASAWLPSDGPFSQTLLAYLQGDIPLGVLCDLLAFALPLSIEAKQSLLEELDIEQRIHRLANELEGSSPPELLPPPRPKRKYPPEFSVN